MEQWRNRLQAAIEAHRAGRPEEAAREYRELGAEKPEQAHPPYLLGVLAMERWDYVEARDCFVRALERDRAQTVYWCGAGHAYLHCTQYERSVDAYQEALALEPEHAESLVGLARALLCAGRLEAATDRVLEICRLQSGAPMTLCLMAMLQESRGNVEEAQALYDQAIAQVPKFYEAHLQCGAMLAAAQELDSAERYLRRAHDINPQNPRAHEALGRLFLQQSKPAWAEGAFRTAIKLCPTYWKGHAGLALYHEGSGQPRKAHEAWTAAHARGSMDAEVSLGYARSCVETGEADRAQNVLENYLKLSPGDVDARELLAAAQYRLTAFDSSARQMEQAQLERLRMAISPSGL